MVRHEAARVAAWRCIGGPLYLSVVPYHWDWELAGYPYSQTSRTDQSWGKSRAGTPTGSDRGSSSVPRAPQLGR